MGDCGCQNITWKEQIEGYSALHQDTLLVNQIEYQDPQL